MIELYPAIDLRNGRCVRLRQGDYDDETVYGDDPVAMALSFAEAGATWIHVVDLDAARSGDPSNRPVVAEIARALDGLAQVQTGGGVRGPGDARQLADAGVARVVMGTAAVKDPSLVPEVAAIVPVAVGLDHRDGELAVHGWTEGSGIHVWDVLGAYPAASAFVITEIGRDGMLTGPDLTGLRRAVENSTVPVIASGGVASLSDIAALATIEGLAGIITGKAVYEGRLSVAEAVRLLAGSNDRAAQGDR